MNSVYSLSVSNPGPASISPLYLTVYFDSAEESRDFIDYLPPYASYKTEIVIPFSLLGKDTPDRVRVVADGAQIEIATNKNQVIVNSLISIFILFLAVVLGILIKLGKIRINVKKFFTKTPRNTGGVPFQKG